MKKVSEVLICGIAMVLSAVAAGQIAKGISNIQQIKRRKAVI